MSEIVPRLTYSPEGILEVRRFMDFKLHERRGQLFEPLAYMSGVEFVQDEEEAVVRLAVDEELHRIQRDYDEPHHEVSKIISELDRFAYFDYEDRRDGVFSVEFWNDHGANGVIYPQMQRWLNSGGLTDEVSKRAIKAMSLPFGSDYENEVSGDFYYEQGGRVQYASSGSFRLVSRASEFDFLGLYETESEHIERHSKVEWNWMDISTIGSCACWGVDGHRREYVYFSDENQRLYEMNPHNVDYSLQSLSLVLGMATLAFEAAGYEGREDVFDNAEIIRQESHPK